MDTDHVGGYVSVLDEDDPTQDGYECSIQWMRDNNKAYIEAVKANKWQCPYGYTWKRKNIENKRNLWALRLSRKFCDVKLNRPVKFSKFVPNETGTQLVSEEAQPKDYQNLCAFWRKVFENLALKHEAPEDMSPAQ